MELWVKRRFLTGRAARPCSTRKVPLRVMPVRIVRRGSMGLT